MAIKFHKKKTFFLLKIGLALKGLKVKVTMIERRKCRVVKLYNDVGRDH